jgi:hypothetical protein
VLPARVVKEGGLGVDACSAVQQQTVIRLGCAVPPPLLLAALLAALLLAASNRWVVGFMALLLYGAATAGMAADELAALVLVSRLVLAGAPTAHEAVGANAMLPLLLLLLLSPVLLLLPVLLCRGNVLVLRLGGVTSAVPAAAASTSPNNVEEQHAC